MTTQTFTLTMPTAAILNSNDRLHWRVKSDRVKAIRVGAWKLAQSQAFTPMTRAHCVCTLNFGTKQRRDGNNYSDTAKAFVDGLVDAGLLADDDHTRLTGPDMRIGPVGSRGLVTVTLVFTEVAA